MKAKSIFISCCLILFVIGISIPSIAVELCPNSIINLTLASSGSRENSIVRGYMRFAELVSAKSSCQINIQVFSDAEKGGDKDIIQDTLSKSLDIGAASTPNMATFSSEYMIFDLPYITSPRYQRKLYSALDSGELGQYFENIANKSGLTIIMWSEYGYRNLVSTNKPITSIADLAGLKKRTTGSPIEVAVTIALGMQPIPLTWPETYNALKQGVVDAEGNNWENMINDNHTEVLKYAIDSQHNYSLDILFMNKDVYDKLPDDAKKILREAAAEAQTWQRLFAREIDEVSKIKMSELGIKFHDLTPIQREELRVKTRVVWEEFREKLNPKALQLLLDTQK